MTQPVARRDAFVWGCNGAAQLGLGVNEDIVDNPTKINIENVTWSQIVCGAYHTAAISTRGEVFTWGYNGAGQLGHGDCKSRNVPTKVERLSGETVVKVACGGQHTAALTSKGKVLTWGWGYLGKLGHGNELNKCIPTKIEALDNEVVIDVICGDLCTIAVTSSGVVYSCGYDVGAQREDFLTPRVHECILGMNVISLSSADVHAAFVTESGELHTWGKGRCGRLGHGDEVDQSRPRLVDASSGIFYKEVSCGGSHTAVLTDDGRLYTFGRGNHGQLGHGDRRDRLLPTLVQALETTDIQRVQCGDNCTMALTTGGYVYVFGNLCPQDQPSSMVDLLLPTIVDELQDHNVVQISSYYRHCAVLVDPYSPSTIRKDQISHFNNKEHSNVTFMVENTPIYANSEVLSRKSQYFQAMFRSNMRESIEGVVVVPDVSASTFIKMLEYLCLDNFVVDDMDVSTREELVVLADMYLLDGLHLLCS